MDDADKKFIGAVRRLANSYIPKEALDVEQQKFITSEHERIRRDKEARHVGHS